MNLDRLVLVAASYSSVLLAAAICVPLSASAADDLAKTSLANSKAEYRVAEQPYVVLQRGPVRAVIVNNQAVDTADLPGHRGGYSGIGSLVHEHRDENLFVPTYAGLNFEHIHDGKTRARDILFEPRNAPMELRIRNEHTVELYQAPSPHFGLESCLQYHLLQDGTLEVTFECIPRRDSFENGYIGLFWASYIHQPESLDIHFQGHPVDEPDKVTWIRGVTPKHGVLATHVGSKDRRQFTHDADFPLSLVFNRSRYRFVEPWYYGLSHGMAFALVFRPQDEVRITQSPSGGGQGNPAWDFQFLIDSYEVGKRYQKVMRAVYTPYQSPAQMEQVVRPHLKALRQ